MEYVDLAQYELKEIALLKYGFIKQSSGYVYIQPLHQEEYHCQIQVFDYEIAVDVYDTYDNEHFLPFYVKHSQSAYVAEMKAEIDQLITEILSVCFVKCDIKQQLISFAQDMYHTIPVYPWDNLSHCVLKTAEQKWYAIFMNIPYKTLGINKQGIIDIVNVKAIPKLVEQLIDHHCYFPAYHMNKKYWLTVVLDRETDFEKAKELLEQSYESVTEKNNRRN